MADLTAYDLGLDTVTDVPVVNCSCAACRLASNTSLETGNGFNAALTRSAASEHVSASVSSTDAISAAADGSARDYAVLTQTQNADGSWSFSGDRNIDAVLIGSKITSVNLTFAFPDKPADYGDSYDFGQATEMFAFNDVQKAATREAFALVAGYTNLTFTEVSAEEARVERPTFRLAQTGSDSVASAMGNFPDTVDNAVGQNPTGDIWFGRTSQPYYTNPEKGNWGYTTIMHEIGHTLGLKHGGDDYTAFNVGELFGTTTPLYGTRALEWAKDGQLWSLMTYSTAPNSRNAYNGDASNQAQSYMMYDIAALQYLYGANYTTNSTDTTYRWSEATGEKFVNNVGQGAPTGNNVLETIWDGGGNDTYDLSNYTGGVSVDLRPGATSVLSTEQLANAEAYVGGNVLMQGSVGNALMYKGDTRSLIENAIGGAGNDILVGNQANNVLTGNAGNDVFDGLQGSDTIIGGDGADTVTFSSSTTGITVALNNGTTDIRVVNGNDVDTLSSIENIGGTAFSDSLTGDDDDNMLAGGAGGNDTLIGGAGNDRLIGGGFELSQPTRPDVVKTNATVNNSRATAVSLDGSFFLGEKYGVENAATIPHATVVGTVARAGYEYYSFSVQEGATFTIDVDVYGSIYAGLLLVDANGVVVASNYEALRRDEGSRLASDPVITYTAPASGTYYAVITNSTTSGGNFVSTNLPVGFQYTINVSLEGAAVPAPTLVSTATAMLDGGAGDDVLVATMGNDTVSGGSGIDTVSYERSYVGVSIDLNTTAAQQTGAGLDTIIGVENVTGSRQADTIFGNAGNNVIDGFGGNDTLFGGAGTDTLSFASETRGISFDLSRQGAAQAVRLGVRVQASGFENLTGSAFADTLSGDSFSNLIDGGASDDVLTGDALGRINGVDTLVGGAGTDTASFAPYTVAITASLAEPTGIARAGATTIATLNGIENLRGGSGADILTGSDGVNMLEGGVGNDRLEGLAGDDILDGGAGDDTMVGGAGSDTAVYAGTANLTLDLNNEAAQDTGYGLDQLSGVENVRLGSGSNRVTGNAAANIFYDGTGSDIIDGGDGVDTVNYSAATGRVNVDLSLATAQVTGGAGTDTLTGIENLVASAFGGRLTGSNAANILTGGAGFDVLIGGNGADTLIGGAGNDFLSGDLNSIADLSHAGRDDVLDGGDGNDYVIGGQGNDTIRGGAGNDTLVSGTYTATFTNVGYSVSNGNFRDGGNDVIDGGEGIDYAVLQFEGRADSMAIDLSDSSALNMLYSNGQAVGSVTNVERTLIFGGLGDDRFVGTDGYDQIRGSAGNDTLIGGLGDDTLIGGLGNDYLDGGEGFDTVDYGYLATGGATIDLRVTTAQDTGTQGVDTLLNVEQIFSSAFTDTIIGGDENLFVTDNRGGNDTFIGNGGNDNLQVIRFASYATASTIMLDGGDGEDTLNFLGGLLPDRGVTDTQLPVRDIVTASGGAGNDFMTIRGARTATIDAGSGNDIVGISIAGSNATGRSLMAYDITLGEGQDELAIQWANADIASFDRDQIIVRDFVGGTTGDLLGLTGILNSGLTTTWSSLDDPFLTGHVTLVKQGGDTVLQVDKDGRGSTASMVTVMRLQGTDAFSLELGNIYAYVVTAAGLQTTAFYNPIITQYIAADQTRLEGHAGRDSLQGGAGDDVLVGLAGDDFLNSFAGDDTLDGGAGADYMVGGLGNDTYMVDDAGDRTIEAADQGYDTVRSTLASYTLQGNLDRLELVGTGGQTGIGNDLNNVIVGSAGNDTLDGGAGADTMAGGAGDDTYVVDSTTDSIIELAGGGSDTVRTALATYTLTADLENLVLTGTTGQTGVGNELANTLTGNVGNDSLFGLAGNDLLDGGAGADTMVGGIGDDTYVVDNASDIVTELAGEGVDTVRTSLSTYILGTTIENLVLTGAGDSIGVGNALDNVLTGGIGGDELIGAAGNDILDGGLGADYLSGGSGDDRYMIDDAGDQITEFGGGGDDTVMASISYVLGAGLENLILTGTASINATGNDTNNYILGNAANNLLSGGVGDDTIVTVTGNAAYKPDAGADRVDGGSGSDTMLLGGFQSDYRLLSAGGRTFLVTARSATEVSGIEQAGFFGSITQSWSSVLSGTAAFDAMSYIAGYSDLRAFFGTNTAAATQHFLDYGFAEGRGMAFNALNYLATYSDLRAAYGTDVTAAAKHYIEYGAAEGRSAQFDGWAYLASYYDLIGAYGANEQAAAKHFIQYGASEGRTITFDALAYGAAYADLTAAFGTDEEALARHYVLYGYAEGRNPGGIVATPVASAPAAAHGTVPASAFVDPSASPVDSVKFTGDSWFGDIGVPHTTDMLVIA